MFDIGFPELLMVTVVALLVIGPDKLPETVRTIALWVGRIRRSISEIKTEIENEIGADEIRRQLHNESIMKELDKTKSQIGGVIRDAEGQIAEIRDSATIRATPATPASETDGVTTDASDATKQAKENDRREQSESGR